MPIVSRNPSTGEIIKQFESYSDEYVDKLVLKSYSAHKKLKKISFNKRAVYMMAVARILNIESEKLGKILTQEMGKTHTSAIAEIKKSALGAEHYAITSEDYMADDIIKTNALKSYRSYQPIGPILAVMPWNYPVWQVIRFAAPAIMAGNTVLLKHASNVTQCALYLEDIFKRAGFHNGVFQTLIIPSSKVERVLRNENVRAATLTGSEIAGSSVAAICGQEIKPTVLELGGSDAFIVMPSADLEKAADVGTTARTQNNGQSCIAAKRFIVHAEVYEVFKEKLIRNFAALKIGDPMKPETDIGPLVNRSSLNEVEDQVKNALYCGAKLLCGGKAIKGQGYFFQPGIIEKIPKSARIYSEEIFAPVAGLYKVNSIVEAIELANDSPFGLGSSIWTSELGEQKQAIDDIEAGATFVNAMTSSDPRLPFGGIKRSGYGRELAAEGLRAFCNVKTVSIHE
ncbi:aldehyde dehydrogenase family protein [Hellea sp.]|nr:aldehyde dehydrogenase family protein [Hellea sp.]MDB4845461.1 aldehyde dehydrogenase family protein [Hellea sp.]